MTQQLTPQRAEMPHDWQPVPMPARKTMGHALDDVAGKPEARLCVVQQTGELLGFVPKHIIGQPFPKESCWSSLIKHGIRCAAIARRRLGALLLERHELAVAHGKQAAHVDDGQVCQARARQVCLLQPVRRVHALDCHRLRMCGYGGVCSLVSGDARHALQPAVLPAVQRQEAAKFGQPTAVDVPGARPALPPPAAPCAKTSRAV